MPDDLICPNCDRVNKPDQQFCGYCGSSLYIGATRPLPGDGKVRVQFGEPAQQDTYAPKPTTGRIMIYVVPVLAFLLIAAVAALLLVRRDDGGDNQVTVSPQATATEMVAAMVAPTDTPVPTKRPIEPTMTNPPTPTELPPTPRPSPTIPPPPTGIPTPTAIADTPPGTVLDVGQAWHQNNWDLTLILDGPIEINDFQNSTHAQLMGVHFKLLNRGSHDIGISYSTENFTAVDNTGAKLVGQFVRPSWWARPDCGSTQVIVSSGKEIEIGSGFVGSCLGDGGRLGFYMDYADASKTNVVITANGISSISDARWRVPLYH
jgi:zinc-ribbon domain